jgi:hypothetical protein
VAALVPSAETDDAGGGEPGDLVLGVAERVEDLVRVRAERRRRRRDGAALPSAESGAATVTKSPSDCRIPSVLRLRMPAPRRRRAPATRARPPATSASSSSADSRSLVRASSRREELHAVRDAVGVRAEPGVAGELRQTEDAAQRAEELSFAATTISSPSRVGNDLVWRDLRERTSLAARDEAGAQVADELVREQESAVSYRESSSVRPVPVRSARTAPPARRAPPRPGADVDEGYADAHGRPAASP